MTTDIKYDHISLRLKALNTAQETMPWKEDRTPEDFIRWAEVYFNYFIIDAIQLPNE